MYRFFLAYRYLWHRPLSWVSILAIWLSVTALICTVAIMSGFLGEMRDVIRGTTSDVILTPFSVQLKKDTRLPAPRFEVIESRVKDVEGVAGMSPHILRPGMLSPASVQDGEEEMLRIGEASPVQVVGLDPQQEAAVTGFADFVQSAEDSANGVVNSEDPFETGIGIEGAGTSARLPVALLGTGLAEQRGLKPGDVVSLVTTPENIEATPDQILSGRFRVGGLVRTGHFQNDGTTVYLDLSAARKFAEAPQGTTEICVRAVSGVEADVLASRLRSRLQEVGLPVFVETWRERHARLLNSVENQRSILAFLLFFFVVVACFNVFATLTILVSDKTRDIGVMNALGSGTAGVASVFTGCAVFITITGATLGCVTGVLVALNINRVNDLIKTLTGKPIFRADIYVFDKVPVDIEPTFVALVFGATLGFAILSALIPSVRAARLDPVAALRYE